jgi:hypothetical protein
MTARRLPAGTWLSTSDCRPEPAINMRRSSNQNCFSALWHLSFSAQLQSKFSSNIFDPNCAFPGQCFLYEHKTADVLQISLHQSAEDNNIFARQVLGQPDECILYIKNAFPPQSCPLLENSSWCCCRASFLCNINKTKRTLKTPPR